MRNSIVDSSELSAEKDDGIKCDHLYSETVSSTSDHQVPNSSALETGFPVSCFFHIDGLYIYIL